jgi:hypothetical protein
MYAVCNYLNTFASGLKASRAIHIPIPEKMETQNAYPRWILGRVGNDQKSYVIGGNRNQMSRLS